MLAKQDTVFDSGIFRNIDNQGAHSKIQVTGFDHSGEKDFPFSIIEERQK